LEWTDPMLTLTMTIGPGHGLPMLTVDRRRQTTTNCHSQTVPSPAPASSWLSAPAGALRPPKLPTRPPCRRPRQHRAPPAYAARECLLPQQSAAAAGHSTTEPESRRTSDRPSDSSSGIDRPSPWPHLLQHLLQCK
jgi:hypothetical protein